MGFDPDQTWFNSFLMVGGGSLVKPIEACGDLCHISMTFGMGHYVSVRWVCEVIPLSLSVRASCPDVGVYA